MSSRSPFRKAGLATAEPCVSGFVRLRGLRSLGTMNALSDTIQIRVRYAETDQMGTFYNARALDWFECGRTELMRNRMGMSYAGMETKGAFLPLVEAHLEYQGRARYDDLLEVATTAAFSGMARMRFDVQITLLPDRRPVVKGYTVHAFTNVQGKAIRPPKWFVELFDNSAG